MRKRLLLLGLAAPLVLLISGCWDAKVIQDTNYITAIGLDYRDGKYVVFGQMLDFSNVAKQEGGRMGKSASWTGREEGETVMEALNNLYRTSQQRVFWGHVSAIVFTESAIKHGMRAYLDGLGRSGETRFTQWVYGTRQPIDRIFAAVPFFNLSSLASILHQPVENYKQFSYIRPIQLYRIFVELREPGYTVLLPSLGIENEDWKKNGKPDPKLMMDGVFAVDGSRPTVWLEASRLSGLRWLDSKTERAMIVVNAGGKPAAAITIEKPKAKIVPRIAGGRAAFDIRVRCRGFISELVQNQGEKLLEREAEAVIRAEIERTFAYGRVSSADLYNLEPVLYRKAFPDWSKLTGKGARPLADFKLGSVSVDVNLRHSSMYHLEVEKSQY